MAEHDEIELKIDVTPEDAEAIAASPLLANSVARHERLRSIYFDLPGEPLRAAGLSLRIREEDGRRVQTVKVAGERAAGLFARREWERPVDGERPVIDDTLPLRTVIGHFDPALLAPLFEVRVERTIHEIAHDDATIELAIDRGIAAAGEHNQGFCEIELELLSGSPAALFALVRRLDVNGHVGVLSKAERGYRLLASQDAPAARAEPVALHADMTAMAGFHAIAYACLRQFRLNEMALAAGDDEEALHQARVALRRLRAVLSLFRDMLGNDRRKALHGELRWLAGELGLARATDVLIEMVEDDGARERLKQARPAIYAQARAALDSARARAAMLDLAEWIATGPWTTDPETAELRDRPLAILAATALDRLRRRIKRAGDLRDLDDAGRHRVRIAAKKLRYASDYFTPLFPGRKAEKRAARFVKALAKLQDRLGRLNDMVTAPAMMRRIGAGAAPGVAARRKARLIADAARARADLLDLKRFWR